MVFIVLSSSGCTNSFDDQTEIGPIFSEDYGATLLELKRDLIRFYKIEKRNLTQTQQDERLSSISDKYFDKIFRWNGTVLDVSSSFGFYYVRILFLEADLRNDVLEYEYWNDPEFAGIEFTPPLKLDLPTTALEINQAPTVRFNRRTEGISTINRGDKVEVIGVTHKTAEGEFSCSVCTFDNLEGISIRKIS
jgi:hypothetical protein